MGIDLYEFMSIMMHTVRLIILVVGMRDRRKRTAVRVEVTRLSIKIESTKEPPKRKS